MVKLLNIDVTEAATLDADSSQTYTPGVDEDNTWWFYKETYTTAELPLVTEFTQTMLDGLTPINPTKPMFPRKP